MGPPFRGFRASLVAAEFGLTPISVNRSAKKEVSDGSKAPYQRDFKHHSA
jgi:hypothetical protein